MITRIVEFPFGFAIGVGGEKYIPSYYVGMQMESLGQWAEEPIIFKMRRDDGKASRLTRVNELISALNECVDVGNQILGKGPEKYLAEVKLRFPDVPVKKISAGVLDNLDVHSYLDAVE